jgi:hypothetical protein
MAAVAIFCYGCYTVDRGDVGGGPPRSRCGMDSRQRVCGSACIKGGSAAPRCDLVWHPRLLYSAVQVGGLVLAVMNEGVL